MDVRAYLHRDGSVIMQISLEDLQNPHALYQEVRRFCYTLDSQCIEQYGTTNVTSISLVLSRQHITAINNRCM